jgi:hypothetical protein
MVAGVLAETAILGCESRPGGAGVAVAARIVDELALGKALVGAARTVILA